MGISYLKMGTCYRVVMAWLPERFPDISPNSEGLNYGCCKGDEWISFHSADGNYRINFDAVHRSGSYDFSLSVSKYSEDQDKFIPFWGECKHYAAADELLVSIL